MPTLQETDDRVFGEEGRLGKGNVCPHCNGAVKVFLSIPALLLWLVPAIVVVVFLYPWLGFIATMLAGSAALFLSVRIRAVA